ncbi:MAG: NAD-glutamate dehydrogenase [Rhodovibrionaceae bacterium]
MTSGNDSKKRQLVDKVAAAVKKKVGGKAGATAERFTQQFLANVPPDDLLGEDPGDVTGRILSIWDFAQQRTPGKPKLRIYNPSSKEHGWASAHTVVEAINDDMPFLVDSITAELNLCGAEVHLIVHPVMDIERTAGGKFKALGAPDEQHGDGFGESCMQLQISEQPKSRHKAIVSRLETILEDVRLAVEDWLPMRQRCRDLMKELQVHPPKLPRDEVNECLSFLEWLDDDHFTYLGYREYSFTGSGENTVAKIDNKSAMGILRDSKVSIFDGLRNLGQLPAEVQDFVKTPELLRVTKANRRATVHRAVHLDTVAVKTIDAKGRVAGERLFVGLFTSVAYSRSPREIPLLRHKVDAVMSRAGFMPGSHDGKALMHILESYPRDELFQISEKELYRTAIGILHLQERQRTALFVRRDPFERFVSALVYVPRDRYDTSLRLKLQDILTEAYSGEVASFSTFLGDATLARLHLLIRTEQGKIPRADTAKVERALAHAARSWSDELEHALVEKHGEERGLTTCRRYRHAFPASYQEDHVGKDAAADIANIEAALESGDISMDLYRPVPAGPQELHFKIYVAGSPIPLSDVLPMLERMGLKVIGEVPYEIHPEGAEETVWIHDFSMRHLGPAEIDNTSELRNTFHEVFHEVWHDRMENDGFNGLVLSAGLTAREIKVLRAYCKYLRQAQIPFSQSYMEETLGRNPRLATLLAELFMARFDPARRKGADKAEEKLVAEIRELLEQVSNLDEDRIIRRYLNMIRSTLRTNFFQTAEDGGPKSYISFKLDSQALLELPLPRPFREIFVYSPRIEGVHLRFGMVARGGLRWSDRMEDFRTEVLGLVKAQQVKNAVIVPVGSKGGFVGKRLPEPAADRKAWLDEGIECYKTFIRGLLDITDNLKGKKVVPPKRVVRHDGDDPYLVVAADKGTATFSDIANGVSVDYGFWLDDAFASGGSAGYDHKAMGITARGAWESVKRHFREIGKNIQEEDFTCIGIGDMGGDVFGNGMLLSKHICLKAAFNHLHIFVDPSPDAATSWKERKRLFDQVKGWGDYDAKLISKGGGVFDRKAKSIKISAEMKAAFALTKDSMTPNELIHAILKSQAELLWFGGIGTYVRASDESNGEVGDRANDSIRITARELAAEVVGEGANLGMTQKSRIEYGLLGGRCNTDAIDNSAGVDCSDHEVNIKILLGAVEESGKMTRAQRNKLLEKMTEEVAQLVLRDNYLQTQSITVTQTLGHHLLDRLGRFMRSLEKAGQLDRSIEFLPDDETVTERFKQGIGLARAEISVLLSYAKLVLYAELLASDLPDDGYLKQDLVDYFPTPLRKTYEKAIAGHRLRREITATSITNEIVNRMGIAFVHEVGEKTGMPSDEIARSYIVAREVFGLQELWDGIEALDNKVPAETQSAMLIECGRQLERAAVWLLRNCSHPIAIASEISNYGAGVAELTRNISGYLSEAGDNLLKEKAASYKDSGVPEKLALRVATLSHLAPSLDVVRIANLTALPVEDAGKTYFRVGERFGFDWLRRAAGHLPSDNAWDKLAITAIVDDLFGYQSDLVLNVLYDAKAKSIAGGKKGARRAPPDAMIDLWAEDRIPLVHRSDQLVSELRAAGTPDLSMLAVANRQLKSMVV